MAVHKVYETTSTYKGRQLKMRHTLTDVDEDLPQEDALQRIERSVLPEGATNSTIRDITAEDPQGPLAKVPQVGGGQFVPNKSETPPPDAGQPKQ
jgi:hypothetical protein